jgi:hypothetical protein
MKSVLQVPPTYQTAGFGLADLDETESSGHVNDSIFATVLTVSPVDTRKITRVTFVDNIPKGALVFTRNLTKTCVDNDVYNDDKPQWPEQRSLSWDRPEHLKQFKIEFSPADYLEAGTIDQINYHLFELSKTKKFKHEDLPRLFNRWRLAGISYTNDVVTDDFDGSERMLNLQVVGRVAIPNYFEGPVSPDGHRHLFVALKFIRLGDPSDTLEFSLMNSDMGTVTVQNTRPPQADRFKLSNDLFDNDGDFNTRLIPQLFFASSFHENVPRDQRFVNGNGETPKKGDEEFEILFHKIGHVLLNNSASQGPTFVGDKKTLVNSSSETATRKRETDIHISLKLF